MRNRLVNAAINVVLAILFIMACLFLVMGMTRDGVSLGLALATSPFIAALCMAIDRWIIGWLTRTFGVRKVT